MKISIFVMGIQLGLAAILGFGAIGLYQIAIENIILEAERRGSETAKAQFLIEMDIKELAEHRV